MNNFLYSQAIETFNLKVGDPARDFVLKTDTECDWKLSSLFGKVTVLLFYPKSETLVCTKQLCSVRDHWRAYLQTKAEVVGISPGTIEEHRNFRLHHRLPLTILADTDRQITKIYGRHEFLPVSFTRAIVIIDAKGIIRYRNVMLRAFRPSDKTVLANIYAARNEILSEKYKLILDSFRNNRSK